MEARRGQDNTALKWGRGQARMEPMLELLGPSEEQQRLERESSDGGA